MTDTFTAQNENRNGFYTSLIFISLVLTLCTVVLSAYIRLAQSGLDCSPWPECYGMIGVEAERQGIAVLTREGAEMSHKGARIAHRFIASTLGITVLLILLIAVKRKLKGEPGLLAAMLIMGATLFLAILGYSTPARTTPWITLGNLSGGMFMLAALWWLMQSNVAHDRNYPLHTTKSMAIGLLVLFSLQLLSGAWVSATFSATACNGHLVCGDFSIQEIDWIASFDPGLKLAINPQGSILPPDPLANGINLTHRLLALINLIVLSLFASRLLREHKVLATTGKTLLVLLSAEVIIGVVSVYTQLPLFMVTAHNLLAALILLCLVNITLYTVKAHRNK